MSVVCVAIPEHSEHRDVPSLDSKYADTRLPEKNTSGLHTGLRVVNGQLKDAEGFRLPYSPALSTAHNMRRRTFYIIATFNT